LGMVRAVQDRYKSITGSPKLEISSSSMFWLQTDEPTQLL